MCFLVQNVVFLFFSIRVPFFLHVVENMLRRDTKCVLVIIGFFFLERCQVPVQTVRLSRGTPQKRSSDIWSQWNTRQAILWEHVQNIQKDKLHADIHIQQRVCIW